MIKSNFVTVMHAMLDAWLSFSVNLYYHYHYHRSLITEPLTKETYLIGLNIHKLAVVTEGLKDAKLKLEEALRLPIYFDPLLNIFSLLQRIDANQVEDFTEFNQLRSRLQLMISITLKQQYANDSTQNSRSNFLGYLKSWFNKDYNRNSDTDHHSLIPYNSANRS